jgi:hypothetical protein
MQVSLYNLLYDWANKTWNDIVIMDSMDQLVLQLKNRKLTFLPFQRLWKLLDDLTTGMGLIMEDSEKQEELNNALETKEIRIVSESFLVDFQDQPSVTIKMVNLDEIMASNPEWFQEISDVERMFTDVSDSYKGK